MINETRKILNRPELAITATTVRVPVFDCHSESINVEFNNPFELEDVVETLKNKPDEMEIVLTGRNAHPKIIEIAHLVSEIKPVKHYWDTGIAARKGIEY